jgi:hypothetical protein
MTHFHWRSAAFVSLTSLVFAAFAIAQQASNTGQAQSGSSQASSSNSSSPRLHQAIALAKGRTMRRTGRTKTLRAGIPAARKLSRDKISQFRIEMIGRAAIPLQTGALPILSADTMSATRPPRIVTPRAGTNRAAIVQAAMPTAAPIGIGTGIAIWTGMQMTVHQDRAETRARVLRDARTCAARILGFGSIDPLATGW